MSDITFSKTQLLTMNKTDLWRNSIVFYDNNNINNNNNNNTNYQLHATGYTDITTGRQYIALPYETPITNEIIKRYNLFR